VSKGHDRLACGKGLRGGFELSQVSYIINPMTPFESHLYAALEKQKPGTAYLAAVSGGADSTAMLAALAELRKEAPFKIYCVHVEHGIRSAEESKGDAKAVRALCEKLKVPCRVITIPRGKIAAFASESGTGIEAAARHFRHRALSAERRRVKADWILTAHTRDDLLETMLMRFLRGSGPAGLAPMMRNKGRIMRPLLEVTRQDVLSYLEERGIQYRTDSTNDDISFLRNRVRHKLVPVLDAYFPSWRSSVFALATTQELVADFMESEAKKRLPWEDLPREALLRLREEDFLSAPPILREEAVFAAVDLLVERDGKLPSHDPKRSVIRRTVGEGTAADLGQARLERRNGFIILTPGSQRGQIVVKRRGFSLLIKEAGFYNLRGEVFGVVKNLSLRIRAGYTQTPPNKGFSANLPIVFRNHRAGDFIYKGGRKRRFSDILNSRERSGYTAVVTACDAQGSAAFVAIGADGEDFTVISRDDTQDRVCCHSFFEISMKHEGIDA
jgi:tRNA(Ile)-lysidine synthase